MTKGEATKLWLNGNLVRIVTTALAIIMAAAAIGTNRMASEFSALKEEVTGFKALFQQHKETSHLRFRAHDMRMDRLSGRVQYIERDR